jgi:hypothetical protein
VRAFVGAIILALVIAGPVAGQTSGTSIVAGQSAAGVRIGGTADEAVSALGALFQKADTKSGK